MKLNGDFFTILNLHALENSAKISIEINPFHEVFSGHFPGRPVVPGVCMMQMVKEITESITGEELNLVKAENMKFLAIINPLQNKLAEIELKYDRRNTGEIDVTANISINARVYFKFKGIFV